MRVNKAGDNALKLVFEENAEKIDFGSKGFKLLWKKEKSINVD